MEIAVLDLEPDPAAVAGRSALGVACNDAGHDSITVIAIGPPDVDPGLRTAIGIGADRAIRIWEPSFGPLTPPSAAELVVAALGGTPEAILCAPVAESSLLRGTPGAVAARTDRPVVGGVTGVTSAGTDTIRVRRRDAAALTVDGGVVGLAASGADPGYATISRLVAGVEDRIDVRRPAELGVSSDSRPEVHHQEGGRAPMWIDEPPDRAADALVELLFDRGLVSE